MLKRFGILTAAILMSSVVAAIADPIRIVQDGRRLPVLAVVGDGNGTVDRHSNVHIGDGSTTVSSALGTSTGSATATLSSDISDPAHLSGTGSAATLFDTSFMADTSAAATFVVTFHLDTAHLFDFAGTFNASGEQNDRDAPFRTLIGGWTAALHSGATTFFEFSGNRVGGRTSHGFIGPGDYSLLVEGTALAQAFQAASGSANANFNFRFDLTADPSASATPEPASLLLLATGAAGLVARTRKRKSLTPRA